MNIFYCSAPGMRGIKVVRAKSADDAKAKFELITGREPDLIQPSEVCDE